MQLVAQHCVEHADSDLGCALVLPRFERRAGGVAKVSLHIGSAELIELFIQSSSPFHSLKV